ncbi:MAG: hypothetical protein QQN41_02485 [Nitrosopumilus sp.]
MSYAGNLKGPRKSEIVSKLGADYFGITLQVLQNEILELEYEEEEVTLGVDPVHVDEKGQPYLEFLAPGKRIQRYYLEENGYKLEGEIKTYTEEEQIYWKRRKL